MVFLWMYWWICYKNVNTEILLSFFGISFKKNQKRGRGTGPKFVAEGCSEKATEYASGYIENGGDMVFHFVLGMLSKCSAAQGTI